jgi:hypothetical protein
MIKKPNVIADLTYLALVFALALVLMPSGSQAQATCMYCRRADVTRTFMVTYSYCEASDTCLQDKWLYIDRPCSTSWKRGEDVDLMSCEPTAGLCHSFVSSEQAAGQFLNHTETLASGEYCEINVDATAHVARVVFDDALTLGVELSDYTIGDVYDIEKGKTKKIIVYNGDTSGAITFTLAFS